MPTTHRIIFGDSRWMREVCDESVHLIVTSPPYWQLKDYGVKGQIGFDQSYEDYINSLNLVWAECERVLHRGCRLCINIGDQFARAAYYGRYKVIPIRTEITRFCETIGLDYMGAIIWQKVTTMNTTGGATIMGSYPYPRNGIVKLDYEFILLFKKPGEPPEVSDEAKSASQLTLTEWNKYFYGHWDFPGERVLRDHSSGRGRGPRPFADAAQKAPQPYSPGKLKAASPIEHIAPFPEELPRRLIKMFSFVGETVLDPFLGSGTTTLAAKNLSRNSIGYEINRDFRPIIEQKVGAKEASVFGGEARFEFIEQEGPQPDLKAAIDSLPYRFKDVVKVERKIDPRLKTFGSRIKAGQQDQIELFKVKRIEAPDLIVLGNDRRVRLLGIRPIEGRQPEAIAMLERLTKGQKVFLKEGKRFKYDQQGNLLAYVYLQNKTFVNAKLIKSGLVEVDTRYE